ncbi:Rossmann-like and DUF2520 domain-containing protein [Flavihumibacter stibioxidans]|uniref:DUF2520 domain-containing protein n=1 Tax=Flavihumibacter stibioxidans TaxID=1834163 RepID=A0ABR7M361_9BACT|nr:Rossmann-like and DUF2520 domain-containing protein [Flavihumibacter stibioxidans]MBC6489453.1 hypothetical protein [Flavihumibacter stibioxidans]
MNIVIIGTGNVAKVLGIQLKNAGHRVVQVVGRNEHRADELATLLGSSFTTSFSTIRQDAHLYLAAITDNALPELQQHLRLPGKWIFHTAGSVPADVLSGISENYGVLYPLQSLRGKQPATGQIPFLINASREAGLQLLKNLLASLNASFQVSTDAQRLKMHLAAVWVNNFANYLYSIAFRICRENQLDFALLYPLIHETGLRLSQQPGTCPDPFQWQTGPAIRHDDHTINRHLQLLEGHADWQDLYSRMTAGIQETGAMG